MSEAHTLGKLMVTLQDTNGDRYKRMFEAACVALGEIGDALGCDPNEGGSEPILDAVDDLKGINADLLAALQRLVDEAGPEAGEAIGQAVEAITKATKPVSAGG